MLLIVNESHIFLLGLIIMILTSIWFFFNRHKNEKYLTASLVTLITSLSYAILTSRSIFFFNGTEIYYTRWLFYAVSCSLLILSILSFLKIKKEKYLAVIVLNIMVMISGATAAVLSGEFKWMTFWIGTLCFAFQLVLMFEKIKADKKTKFIGCYILFGWSIFPIVFVLAPEGLNLINNVLAAILYLILDLYTKIIFYLHLNKKFK